MHMNAQRRRLVLAGKEHVLIWMIMSGMVQVDGDIQDIETFEVT